MVKNSATVGDVKPTYGVRIKNKIKKGYLQTSSSKVATEPSAIDVRNEAASDNLLKYKSVDDRDYLPSKLDVNLIVENHSLERPEESQDDEKTFRTKYSMLTQD